MPRIVEIAGAFFERVLVLRDLCVPGIGPCWPSVTAPAGAAIAMAWYDTWLGVGMLAAMCVGVPCGLLARRLAVGRVTGVDQAALGTVALGVAFVLAWVNAVAVVAFGVPQIACIAAWFVWGIAVACWWRDAGEEATRARRSSSRYRTRRSTSRGAEGPDRSRRRARKR